MRRRQVLYRLLALLCDDCGSFLWPWQRTCGQRHTTCKHAGDLAIWRRNEYPVPMWACSFCGEVPS